MARRTHPPGTVNDAWLVETRLPDENALLKTGALRIEVTNFAAITHAVPAERVRANVPDVYEVETFVDTDGIEKAFVTATCFCNDDFRWAHSPYPKHTFNENTYRGYVTADDKKGLYFFGRYLGSPLAVAGQRTIARDTWLGNFSLNIGRGPEGYTRYDCDVTGSRGGTHFRVVATDQPPALHPFSSGEEMAQHITYRLNGFFTTSAGFQGRMPVAHPRMRPYSGRLLSGRFDLWTELDILEPDEVMSPYSVLVEPGVTFTLYPPRTAK